ncbi:hypothetical protein B0O80DRAFT_470281 [Mortierella sp. GBAus27b]|nr:hypothetical protein B0O80DRAFT_470281 [Mortierella sp. GBAus27b]
MLIFILFIAAAHTDRNNGGKDARTPGLPGLADQSIVTISGDGSHSPHWLHEPLARALRQHGNGGVALVDS